MKVLLISLEPYIKDEADPAHSFAVDVDRVCRGYDYDAMRQGKPVKRHFTGYFEFLLNSESPVFLPIYWTG